MTVHLRVRAGVHELLLDTACVQRVAEAADVNDVGAWAGADTPVLDLATQLGSDDPAEAHRALILYGPVEARVVLIVTDVEGLVSLEPSALVPMPAISASFGRLFDAICVQPIEGRHPLRLRSHIGTLAPMREGA